jgi:hypothetical protein
MPLILEHINDLIDLIRLLVSITAVVVFSVGFFVPLFGTYLPYRREIGRPSGAMTSRLILRGALLLLVISTAIFSVLRNFMAIEPVVPHIVVTTLYFITVIGIIYSWHRHPDGVRGL